MSVPIALGSLLTLLPLLAAEAEPPPALPDPGHEQAVSLLAVDRFHLQGSLHRPAGLPEEGELPAVIVVHPFARNRELSDVVISVLLERGFAVLSMDLRGHGQSYQTPDHKVLMPPVLKPRDAQDMVRDQLLLVDYLVRQPAIDGEKIGILGSGLSALIAVEAAGADERIGAVALVGPSDPVFGISGDEGMEKLGDRPAWIGTSSTNQAWLRRAEALAGIGSGERTLSTYEASVPRTAMLLDLPELTGDLAAWFDERLTSEEP
jgi:pimeloyl-ACP methyl ester carboxylesterase